MVEWPANAIARKDILVRDVDAAAVLRGERPLEQHVEVRVHAGRRHDRTRAARDADADDDGGAAPAWPRHRGNLDEAHAGQCRCCSSAANCASMPQYSAFLAPPNGITWHAQMNTVEDADGDVALRRRRQRATAGAARRAQRRGASAAAAAAPAPAIRIFREIRRSSIRRPSKASRSSSCAKERGK